MAHQIQQLPGTNASFAGKYSTTAMVAYPSVYLAEICTVSGLPALISGHRFGISEGPRKQMVSDLSDVLKSPPPAAVE